MKKTLLLISAAILSITLVSAQNFENATNLAKEANENLVNGNTQAALDGFKSALAEAQQCTEEGAAGLVGNCKTGIVQSQWKLALDAISAGEFENAVKALDETSAAAKEYGVEEFEQKAAEKKLEVHQAWANAETKAAAAEADAAAKKAHLEKAAEQLDCVLAVNGADGKLLLQRGQIAKNLGKKDEAVDFFLKAKEAGEEKAGTQLSKLYLNDAQKANKAKKYDEAISAALKANEYEESANAYRVAAMASQALVKNADAIKYFEKYLELAPDAKDAAAVKTIIANLKNQK